MKKSLRVAIGIGGSLAIAALALIAVYRSYGPGPAPERTDRFGRRWDVFVNPESAPVVWGFIGKGVLITLQIAVVSILLSLVFGLALALLRLSRDKQMGLRLPMAAQLLVAAPATIVVQGVRALPLYLLIIYTFIAAPRLGIDVGPQAAGIFALTLYTSSVLAEVFRAGILSLEKGQFEAASSLGLGYVSKLRFVVLPQALRRMAPAVVSQLITLIKDTSLLNFITVLEVTRRLNILSQQQFNPIETSIVAAAIFFAINFSLSTFVRKLEAAPSSKTRIGPAPKLQSIGSEDQTRAN